MTASLKPEPRLETAGPDPADTRRLERVRQVELLISSILRYGVLLSFMIVALGLILLLVTRQTGYGPLGSLSSIITFHPAAGTAFPHTIDTVITGVTQARPLAIIALGLLILIATPVIRVGVSILAFWYEGDRLYVAITLFVFTILLISFLLGKVE